MTVATDLLKGLNPEQQAAVTAAHGPVLVLAGAGSGKTKTLIHRLAYLIKVCHVPTDSVLAVTFTNKAAQEMRTRVSSLLGRSFVRGGPTVGTFHAVSCRWLRQEAKYLGYPAGFSIYDEDDQKALVKEALRDLGYGVRRLQPGAVLAAISRAKADLITPAQYGAEVADDFFTEVVARVYTRYQELLRRSSAFDFDDLIASMVRIWQDHPSVLERYQRAFRYLLIDEYQDVNRAQYVWTTLLAAKHHNLCVVGDDWQSIYGWRGADFGNILRFSEDYPEAKVVKLEQNYRSTKVIVAASNAVMLRAERKADKLLWTNNQTGEPISLVEVEDEVAEARFVVDEVMRLAGPGPRPKSAKPEIEIIPEGYREKSGRLGELPEYMTVRQYQGNRAALKQFAVLYRTNAQSRALEEACLRAGLPYQLVGSLRFYERREVKDVLAYLRLVLNPADVVSFERAVLSSPRGLGSTTVDAVITAAQERHATLFEVVKSESLDLAPVRQQALVTFAGFMTDLKHRLPKLSVAELISEVVARSGLGEYLRDGTDSGEARLQNIEELKTVAVSRAVGKGQPALERFLTEVALWQDRDNFDERKGGLTLMTVHAAKGLEFGTVFIVGMEEGIFPHNSSLDDPRELEEERRLCYVALTRAQHKAYCTYASARRIFGTVSPGLPSRFLGELPEDLVKVTVQAPF